MIAFFLSRSLPPHTEGSAEPCEAIGASLRTQVRIVFCWFCSHLLFVFSCLLTLAPSVNLTVDTFPVKRGRLTVYVLFFFAKTSFNTTSKRNSLLPSFLSGGQNRNDDRRKSIM